ncbi:hypothetical protein DIS24_g11036 [Lasiodiplodia hormozganensis]|uniref:Uncharacterized protein n=1 Tax=Lasiodiplodia hormozganensis TaxID=869390 RepID=A0AA39X1Q4_9PEZI|nr:hypothetical protein DIS24_g11036 [Lasiodiplodia hormozganensis]
MARPTPGRTSTSPSKPLRGPLQTPPPPDVTTAAPEETPNRRSSRIAARHHPPASPAPLLPRPLPAPKKPLITGNTTTKSPTKASGAKTPATPKRKRETSFSPEKLSSVASKMKRGKGQGGGAAGRSSPLVLKRWSHSGPPVVIETPEKEMKQVDEGKKKKEEDEAREEMRAPFVRRSLFFKDPRFTFFD